MYNIINTQMKKNDKNKKVNKRNGKSKLHSHEAVTRAEANRFIGTDPKAYAHIPTHTSRAEL